MPAYQVVLEKTAIKRMAKEQNVTRSNADAEAPCDAPKIQNITPEKACNRGMTFKDTQCHYNCCY